MPRLTAERDAAAGIIDGVGSVGAALGQAVVGLIVAQPDSWYAPHRPWSNRWRPYTPPPHHTESALPGRAQDQRADLGHGSYLRGRPAPHAAQRGGGAVHARQGGLSSRVASPDPHRHIVLDSACKCHRAREWGRKRRHSCAAVQHGPRHGGALRGPSRDACSGGVPPRACGWSAGRAARAGLQPGVVVMRPSRAAVLRVLRDLSPVLPGRPHMSLCALSLRAAGCGHALRLLPLLLWRSLRRFRLPCVLHGPRVAGLRRNPLA